MTIAEGMAKCGVCGAVVPANLVLQLGGKTVCMNCKGSVSREMAGARPAGELRYAGFWIRFVAKFIDLLVVIVPIGLILYLTGTFDREAIEEERFNPAGNILAYLLVTAYTTFFHGRFGATPGKMAVKIRVVESDGSPIGYGKALGRGFAEILSGICLNLGYVLAAFDKEKQSLHDRICGTRVIYR